MALSEFNRGRIVAFWQAGISIHNIARRIPCSKSVVYKWVNRYRIEGEESVRDQRKNNRGKRFTTAEQDMTLVQQIDTNPFLSVIRSVNASGLQISVNTGRRRLHESNIYCYRAAHKIALRDRHRDDRIAFALHQLQTVTPNDWDRTIWLDEKVFCSADDNRLQVWRPRNSRFNPQYVIPCEQSGRITCAMWGWISAHCPGELIETSAHMDAVEYVDILENVLLPSVRRIYPEDVWPTFRLVHDNSAVHTARIVREWFAHHPEIEVLDWPAKSPDLNLIENIWGVIAKSWIPDYERTRAALVAHARNIWEGLRGNAELFESLNASITHRLELVVARQGWWTGY